MCSRTESAGTKPEMNKTHEDDPSDATTTITLLSLPDELLILISNHMGPPSQLALAKTCKRFLSLLTPFPWLLFIPAKNLPIPSRLDECAISREQWDKLSKELRSHFQQCDYRLLNRELEDRQLIQYPPQPPSLLGPTVSPAALCTYTNHCINFDPLITNPWFRYDRLFYEIFSPLPSTFPLDTFIPGFNNFDHVALLQLRIEFMHGDGLYAIDLEVKCTTLLSNGTILLSSGWGYWFDQKGSEAEGQITHRTSDGCVTTVKFSEVADEMLVFVAAQTKQFRVPEFEITNPDQWVAYPFS